MWLTALPSLLCGAVSPDCLVGWSVHVHRACRNTSDSFLKILCIKCTHSYSLVYNNNAKFNNFVTPSLSFHLTNTFYCILFRSLLTHFFLCSVPHFDSNNDLHITVIFNMTVQLCLTCVPQCQWVYRAFEDVEELQRKRGAVEKEESPFRPYPVENGSDREEENGTNGSGKTQCYVLWNCLFCVWI